MANRPGKPARAQGLTELSAHPIPCVGEDRPEANASDGSLIEFRSLVDAVRYAIEVQNGMVERNAGLLRAKHAAEQASGKRALRWPWEGAGEP
jgi:hypothetical protein